MSRRKKPYIGISWCLFSWNVKQIMKCMYNLQNEENSDKCIQVNCVLNDYNWWVLRHLITDRIGTYHLFLSRSTCEKFNFRKKARVFAYKKYWIPMPSFLFPPIVVNSLFTKTQKTKRTQSMSGGAMIGLNFPTMDQ